MPGRVRISDVASAAGVSIATVSAALNDAEYARISADTRQRVREAASRLGYVRTAGLGATPAVLVDAECQDPGVSSVVPDEVAGAATAVGELVEHGHRRIGFINNPDPILAASGRLQGYKTALERAGIGLDPTLIVAATSVGPEGGYRAARQLLKLSERPTGLFCFRDLMAMGAYQAAMEAGLRLPQDLSIVGFDDMEFAAGLYPAR